MDEAPRLVLKESMTLRKFDGEYEEGKEPVEVITVETVSDLATGEIISQEIVDKEGGESHRSN